MTFRPTDRLDPVLRLGPPRPTTLLRALFVAVLLGLAAAALYADPGADGAAARPTEPSPDGRLPLPAGLVGVPVRLADEAPLAVIQPGDRVDLLAVTDAEPGAGVAGSGVAGSGAARAGRRGGPALLAAGVLVLDAVAVNDSTVLYLALTDAQAHSVLGAEPNVRFGVIVRPR